MKFEELLKLAEEIRGLKGDSVSIEVEGWAYNRKADGGIETQYKYYTPRGGIVPFDTAQDLKTYMENILKPVPDEGVEV